jgi:GAF domain-containing protein
MRPLNSPPAPTGGRRAPLRDPTAADAMRTASRLFVDSHPHPVEHLLEHAARALAADPGDMCLISRARGAALQPVAVAHRSRAAMQTLRAIVRSSDPPSADAFSRAVQRSRGSLVMRACRARTLRLWLPPAYWVYVERRAVSSLLAAPLECRGRVFGTLLLWRENGRDAFVERDLAYVNALAARLGFALMNA